jgi:hypothetical protein
MAGLIGLAAADNDDGAGFTNFNIVEINGDEFGAPKGAGEANKQNSGVANIPGRPPQQSDDRPQVIAAERGNAALRPAELAADAAQGQPNEFAFRRVRKSPLHVRRSDTGEATGERGHAEGGGIIDEVAGDLLWCGGNAPSLRQEIPQITLIGPPRVGRRGGGDEFQDFGIAAAQG